MDYLVHNWSYGETPRHAGGSAREAGGGDPAVARASSLVAAGGASQRHAPRRREQRRGRAVRGDHLHWPQLDVDLCLDSLAESIRRGDISIFDSADKPIGHAKACTTNACNSLHRNVCSSGFSLSSSPDDGFFSGINIQQLGVRAVTQSTFVMRLRE